MSDTPKQVPRRRRGFEAAGKLIETQLRGTFEKRGFSEARLLTHWAEIVGADIAAIAVPVRISHGRGMGGTLVLLSTGAHAPLLEMQKEEIKTRVNACYGYRCISRVQITQTAPTGFSEGRVAFDGKTAPVAKEPDAAAIRAARDATRAFGDPDLQQALERLAQNVLTKRND